MLLAQSPFLNEPGSPGRPYARHSLNWTFEGKSLANGGASKQDGLSLVRLHSAPSAFRQSALARIEAIRSWISRSPDYGRHSQVIWKGAQQDTLQLLTSDLRDTFWDNGLPGIVEQLRDKDPLEKQILLQRLIQAIRPRGDIRHQLVEFARSTATLEKSVLDFLDNTVPAFSALDSIVFDGARLLRSAVYEISDVAQHGEVKATNLARVILSKLHETHFDSAIHVLREGLKVDRRSMHPSALSVQLLCLMAEKSKFAAVRLGVRISSDLCQQLVGLGTRGYFSSEDIAKVMLIGAESGSDELRSLLQRYMGAEVSDSICASNTALEKFKQAFISLPFTLWSPESIHQRDRLLSNVDQLISANLVCAS